MNSEDRTLEDTWLTHEEVTAPGIYWCQHPQWKTPLLVSLAPKGTTMKLATTGRSFLISPHFLFHGPFTCPPLP